MSAVWRAARAAVRRRRLQTLVIGLVVLFSTTTVVVALALLDASSAPFDRAFANQRGAHVVAAFDPAQVTARQLADQLPGVAAVAGPFGQVTLDSTSGPFLPGPLTVVGRPDPGGPVDRLDLWQGRWVTGPGEIVLSSPPAGSGSKPFGAPPVVAGGVTLTVVGWAYSLSQSADGWVSPDQMAALHPTTTQMLYRFAGDASTQTAVDANLTAITAGLPADALIAAQSYLVVKQEAAAGPATYVPFLATFGVLGLLVAVLIVGNVVSGAVVSGFRHIGVLKALGFTPRQVLAVYLVMVSVPALVGCVLGTVLGDLATRPLLAEAFRNLGFGGGIGARPWVWAVALVGVPALVVVAALVPAFRAYGLSAAEAISAGSAPRRGRGLRIQRRLSGTRLPRAVSLGLGLPFARPARTALTVAAVLLGVTTVTFATGLADTVTRVAALTDNASGQIEVRPFGSRGSESTTRSDSQVEQLLRGLPGTAKVAVNLNLPLAVIGQNQPLDVNFSRGDLRSMGYEDELLAGRWLERPDETVVPSPLMRERGLAIGDRLILDLDGRRTALTVVGETMGDPPGPGGIFADWHAYTGLASDRPFDTRQLMYRVQLEPGADRAGYMAAVMAADPGLDASDTTETDSFTIIVVSLSSVLSLLLALVAALGVLNTVALNVRERRRDLGMLKSIGMTPRQVVTMVVTSMAALGAIAGLLGIPLGILAHRIIVPLAADAAGFRLAPSVLHVWHTSTVGLLALAGIVIAVLGALLPARGAARLTIAEVLHNE